MKLAYDSNLELIVPRGSTVAQRAEGSIQAGGFLGIGASGKG